MNIILKKNKSNESLINEYMRNITNNCEKRLQPVKNPIKINSDNIIIPTIENYEDITKYNYNLSQLKMIAKNYKLKISGNKNELISRVYSYLYFSSYIIKIQSIFRGTIVRNYKKLHGPAATKRSICTNTEDFVTMEPIKDINFHQFLSYMDVDGFIYGFDIISLYTLFIKSTDMESIKNPYNRAIIPEQVVKTIKSIIRFSRILKIHINLHYEDDTKNVSDKKAVELRCLSLFQNIDALGNYSNSQWFLSLTRNQIIRFIRELADIWNYRAQLPPEVKINICPPHGDLFRNLGYIFHIIHTEESITIVQKNVLEVLERLVNSGIDHDSKSLGAYYVLGCLTLVNDAAATSLPWLFQSFAYF